MLAFTIPSRDRGKQKLRDAKHKEEKPEGINYQLVMYWSIGTRPTLPPLGLILCTEGSEEQIKYLDMDKTGIRDHQSLS